TAAAQVGLTSADFLRIIRHRLIFIIIFWVLSFGLTAGVTGLYVKFDPSYMAQALVQVDSVTPINVLQPMERENISQEEVARLVSNQCAYVKTPQVLMMALEDADLRSTEWFAWAQEEEREHNEDPMDLLGDIINASPLRDSNLFRVSATWSVPREVMILVNTVVDKYAMVIDAQQRQGIREASEQLGKELERASLAFEQKRHEIEELRGSTESLTEAGEGPTERLRTLMALVTEIGVEMLGRKSQWEQLQNVSPEQLPITTDLQNLLDQDPVLYQLEQRRQQAQDNLVMATNTYGPNHRIVRQAKVSLDAITDTIQEARATKVVRYQNEQIAQAQRSFLEAQDQLLKLRENLEEAKAEQRDKDAKYARYLRLLEERDLLKKDFEGLQEQKTLLTAMLNSKKSIKIDVRSRAIEPKRRSSPRWEIWLPAGGLLGLVLAVGLAFLIEMADSSVRTPRDVHSVSVLGLIPTSDDDEIEIARVETASIDAPHSITAEAFRNLRANLFFSAPAEQQGVILVTSPSGGNGKTTVASNLAISIALSGRRVLLVDANFRRASLPRIFPNMREDGLSNLLIGQGRLSDMITPTSVPGLDVLGAGPIPPNPAELLGGSYLRDVIVDARSQYDQVLFDGPPVLLVSDAMVLAGAMDGILVVCRYRATSRGALQRTLSQLEAINARVFGAVLNFVETRAGGYFRKIYREFYEYQEPEEEEGLSPRRRLDVQMDGTALQPSTGPAGATGAAPGIPPGPVAGPPEAPGPPPVAPPASGGTALEGGAEDLGIDDNVDLGIGQVLDSAIGLDEEPPSVGEPLDSALPELDKEIQKLKSEQALPHELDAGDEFKLEDLDFGSDFRDPDEPAPGGGKPK
ncbi:MAG TPA: polysaccharide biosynthesis tyrosine autokinase, partial [Phycisphaerae bacterium]|nr:polysaccharide biosynthesis tyrosine autokinase [Phycisphaerae bacterium]